MKKQILLLPCAAMIHLFAFTALGQQDDVLLKAMQDEITRNLNELKLPEFEKPFFMAYGIVDQKNFVITASLGALDRSSNDRDRLKSTTRVLVGDYKFNDESLDDNLTSSAGAHEISLPMDDDYAGIRRSFWSTTDQVYRDAARNFEKNKEALKETGKALDDVPHRSFAKTSPVTIMNTLTSYNFKQSEWEERARKLSALFLKHPQIVNSSVIINYTEGYRYLVTTEGTKVRVPFNVAAFRAVAFGKTPEGEQSIKGISFIARTPDQLPSDEKLAAEINSLIQQIESQPKVPKFNEEYSGPVLVMGQAVADLFASSIFGNNDGVMANDNIPKLNGYQYDADLAPDAKVGKTIIGELISVSARPKLKSFNGIDLIGSFDVDDEGVVPPDEVKVIDHGVLKQLLNNRTLTKPNQVANGFNSGSGVFQVSIDSKETEKSLKKKLIQVAKKQKLDYAFILRSAGNGVRLTEVYKVSVADGSEELVRGAALGRISSKNLKHVLGATATSQVFNVGNFNSAFSRGGSGLMSFIVPDAVLIDDVDVNRFNMPTIKEEDYVQNPLTKN